jgi:alginate O-acetyltransferase complex protein AlgI
MQFLSLQFLCFLAIVAVCLRLCLPRWRNLLLLVASYLFYCKWDVRMAAVLLLATVLCYFAGLRESRLEATDPASRITFGAVLILILCLAFFKLRQAVLPGNPLLPLGISYYTFRLVSYLLDVYWGKCEAVQEFVPFAAYVAFFPHMIAGPIQRASSFVPQSEKPDAPKGRVIEGVARMALGFAKKNLVADNLGLFVGSAYAHLHSGSALPSLTALYLYPLQLYVDFSALTDIAIGAGLLLGIEAPENFNAPFAAKSITEFWRRWHMTLTNWVRDYVFMPLRMATRNWGNVGLAVSLTINMVLIGLWHGFTWGFLAYGLSQSIFLVADVLTSSRRHHYYKHHPAVAKVAAWIGPIFVYHVVAVGCVFFRAPSLAIVRQLFAELSAGPRMTREALEFLTVPLNQLAWVAFPMYALSEMADAIRRSYGFRLPDLLPGTVKCSVYACFAVVWLLIAMSFLDTGKAASPFVYALF